MSAIALDLKKTFELNLSKAGILNVPTLQARAAIDASGSMSALYHNGWVSTTLDLFIGAALKFDDNGELDVGFFDNSFSEAPTANADDAGRYMQTKGRGFFTAGGTRFAPILEVFEPMTKTKKKAGFLGKLFGKKEDAAPEIRAYVGIVTDGSNDDRRAFEAELAKSDGKTFYQFIGIGDHLDAPYLTELAKRFKHVGFVHITDPSKMTPDSFYEALCNPKFAAWI